MAVLSELIEVHGELFSHSESAFASAKRQREVPETPNLMMQFHTTPEPESEPERELPPPHPPLRVAVPY
jgi:hypothetical protein